jgi:16S rRNA processing protein RimM
VGWVKQAHGLRGELFVQLYAKKADWLSDLNNISLLGPGDSSLKTWDVEFCRPHKDGLILKVKGISDRNVSETMRRSGVYIAEDLLKADAGEAPFLAQVLGFDVVDREGVILGKIVGFGTNGAQDLLQLKRENGVEALVPFVEAYLQNIDFDKHQVKMDLPPGLLELEEE